MLNKILIINFFCVCLFPCGEGAFFLAAMKLPLT